MTKLINCGRIFAIIYCYVHDIFYLGAHTGIIKIHKVFCIVARGNSFDSTTVNNILQIVLQSFSFLNQGFNIVFRFRRILGGDVIFGSLSFSQLRFQLLVMVSRLCCWSSQQQEDHEMLTTSVSVAHLQRPFQMLLLACKNSPASP